MDRVCIIFENQSDFCFIGLLCWLSFCFFILKCPSVSTIDSLCRLWCIDIYATFHEKQIRWCLRDWRILVNRHVNETNINN